MFWKVEFWDGKLVVWGSGTLWVEVVVVLGLHKACACPGVMVGVVSCVLSPSPSFLERGGPILLEPSI